MTPSTIGILGGIGPEATGLFYLALIRRLQEHGLIRRNQDFPRIVINSIPAPELVQDSPSQDDLRPYLDGLKALDRLGVDFIVMVCNTIHLYHDRLQQAITAPLMDLRAAVKQAMLRRRVPVLLLGTPMTVTRGLYRVEGLTLLEPTDDELRRLAQSIVEFNRGRNREAQISFVTALCEKYRARGAGAVLLGCTELAVMLTQTSVPTINTLDILVEATIKEFLARRRRGRGAPRRQRSSARSSTRGPSRPAGTYSDR